MPSNAFMQCIETMGDVFRLMAFHKGKAGVTRGRKWDVEVLNKAGVVLTYAAWEAYVEDVCREAVDQMATHLPSAASLPSHVREILAKAYAPTDKDPAKSWQLADDGWRAALRGYTETRTDGEDHRGFNTARPYQVESLLWDTVGLTKVTALWRWKHKTAKQACDDLNKAVTLRGSIVHRGRAQGSVTKKQCRDFVRLAILLVHKTDEALKAHLISACGQGFN